MKNKIITLTTASLLLLGLQSFAATGENSSGSGVGNSGSSNDSTSSSENATNTNSEETNNLNDATRMQHNTHADDTMKSDNTKINKRDRSASELTADQQTYSSSDTSITRRIRQDIMKEKNFSTYAQNVKIITVGGKVTVKGPVRTEQEQSSILRHANQVAGASNVTNEMSVVANVK